MACSHSWVVCGNARRHCLQARKDDGSTVSVGPEEEVRNETVGGMVPSIKNRSKPCLLKHFKGAMEAGATLKELAYIMGLVFRESAGGDDCWTHDALGDVQKLLTENIECCPK